jgi:hypothetical protein
MLSIVRISGQLSAKKNKSKNNKGFFIAYLGREYLQIDIKKVMNALKVVHFGEKKSGFRGLVDEHLCSLYS